MKKIALTGNIASGKTIVETYFKDSGIKTLCLDKVTDDLYKDEDIKKLLFKNFNAVNKTEISKLVFNSKEKMLILNKIFHPEILKVMQTFFRENAFENYVIVDGAIIFEAGFQKYFDKIIFVSSNTESRLSRLIKRNNLSKEEALKRIYSQEKEDTKIKLSDYVIYNNGTTEELAIKCQKVKKELELL